MIVFFRYLFNPEALYDGADVQGAILALQALSQTDIYKHAMRSKSRNPVQLIGNSSFQSKDPQEEMTDYSIYGTIDIEQYLPMTGGIEYSKADAYISLIDQYVPEASVPDLGEHIQCPIVREIVDKDKAFVQMLTDVITLYKNKLISVFPNQFNTVFCGDLFNRMKDLHENLLKEFCSQASRIDAFSVCKGFDVYKDKIASVYSQYFYEIDSAVEKLQEILSQNPILVESFERTKAEADNQSKCRDFDLLTVLHSPFQHVLRYHLYVERLVKDVETKSSSDCQQIKTTLELMKELDSHLNECKRDAESLKFVRENFNSNEIPVEILVKNAESMGKFLKESLIHSVKVDKDTFSNVRVFLFQLGIVCVVQNRRPFVFANDPFKFAVHEKMKDKPFFRLEFNSSRVLKIAIKNRFLKSEWSHMLAMVQACVYGPVHEVHQFVLKSFTNLTYCCECNKILKGYSNQGLTCMKHCKRNVHLDCLNDVLSRHLCQSCPAAYVDPISMVSNPLSKPASTAELGGKPTVIIVNPLIAQDPKDDDVWKSNYGEGEFRPRGSTVSVPSTSSRVLKLTRSQSIPQTLSPNDELALYDWFCPVANRDTSYRICSQLPNETFLVRRSDNDPQGGAVMIKMNNEVQNLKIYFDEKGRREFYITKNNFFKSIADLVDHFRARSLESCFPNIKSRLNIPYVKGLQMLQSQLDRTVFSSLAFLKSSYSANVDKDKLKELAKGELVWVKCRQHLDPNKKFIEAMVEMTKNVFRRHEFIVPNTILEYVQDQET